MITRPQHQKHNQWIEVRAESLLPLIHWSLPRLSPYILLFIRTPLLPLSFEPPATGIRTEHQRQRLARSGL